MMRIREEDFWRTVEVYRECSGSGGDLTRRVVQEHLRDNRCVCEVCCWPTTTHRPSPRDRHARFGHHHHRPVTCTPSFP